MKRYSLFFLQGAYRNFMAEESPKAFENFEYPFEDATTKFYVCAYFAREFAKLRASMLDCHSSSAGAVESKVVDREAAFLASLSECIPFEAKGGKSGSAFYKTKDDRFILKQMSRFEMQSLQSFGPDYFTFKSGVRSSGDPSLLATIVGVFKIGFKGTSFFNDRALKIDLLVMENLFYGKGINESYDLKGSIRNRLVADSCSSNLVLLDENLLREACDRPLYIKNGCKQRLLAAIERDTQFLQDHSIMDYSLLVGKTNDGALVLGIIDYIRSFTWDKKIETLVKTTGSWITGSKEEGKTPTIISPYLYRQRFNDAMYKYFILIPDFDHREQSVESGVEQRLK